MLKAQDPAIEKATSVLDYLANDDETMRLYEARQKAMHDEVSRIEGAKKQGEAEGVAKVAKQMMHENIDISVISKVTGLTIGELEEIN